MSQNKEKNGLTIAKSKKKKKSPLDLKHIGDSYIRYNLKTTFSYNHKFYFSPYDTRSSVIELLAEVQIVISVIW